MPRGKNLPGDTDESECMEEQPMDLALLLDPAAFAMVVLGSFVIAWMQNGLPAIREAFMGIIRLPASWRDAERSRLAALIVEDVVAKRGVACADRVQRSCVFTHDLAQAMSDETDFAAYTRNVAAILERNERRRRSMIRVWNDIADAAPALGMLGTVIGLVQMFATMQTAQGIGLAMALCLLTSLYGLTLAHLFAGPLARRLELVADKETAWQDEIANRMLALGRREYPGMAAQGALHEMQGVPRIPHPQALAS